MIIRQTCRWCHKSLTPRHFNKNSLTCKTCTEKIPYPKTWMDVVVVPKPRPKRRWPKYVVDRPPQDPWGECKVCGNTFVRRRRNQVRCQECIECR